MRLYHFLDSHYGLQNIQKRRLKVSNILELNDPFEFLGVDVSNRAFRSSLKSMKSKLAENNGLLCFSATWKNPVLWSHYAERYRGLCLGFDVDDSVVEPVRYVDVRPGLPDVVDQAFMKSLMLTKFAHWAYEQEYRAFVSLKESEGGLYFMNFSPQLVLRRVIVGDRSAVTRAELAEAIGDLHGVTTFQARPAFKTFEVVRQQNEKLWK